MTAGAARRMSNFRWFLKGLDILDNLSKLFDIYRKTYFSKRPCSNCISEGLKPIEVEPIATHIHLLLTAPRRVRPYGPKPYEFIRFGDIHGPKPYKFMGFDDIHGPKPYEFIGFGDIHDPKPYKFIGLGR